MIRKLYIVIITSVLITACETDVEMFTTGEPVPVVYCILNPDQAIQSLRLTRSYQPDRTYMTDINSDSLLIDGALEILIEELDENGVTNQAFFNPVSVAKDSGSFPAQEQWLYQTDMEIHTNTKYQLIIHLDQYQKLLYSHCISVSQFDLLNPSYPEVREIHMQPGYNPRYFWTPSLNAGVYQLGFLFYYDEFKDGQIYPKSLDFQFSTTLMSESSDQIFSKTINSSELYIQLANGLIADSTLIRRSKGVEPYIVCGGFELADALRLQEAGYSFNMMDYSNIGNGLGVFSSRIRINSGVFKLTHQTIDSIAYGEKTYDLNFLDRNDQRRE